MRDKGGVWEGKIGGLGNGQIRKGVAHVGLHAARSGQSKSGGGNMQTKCGVEFIRHNWRTAFYHSAGLIIGQLTSIFNMIDNELYCKALLFDTV